MAGLKNDLPSVMAWIAAIRSASAESFSRYARAPAFSDADHVALVAMHAEDHHGGRRACGSTIWRAASTPFRCGMAMSITTTSGFRPPPCPPPGGRRPLRRPLAVRLALQQQAQAVAHHRVVVGQQNANGFMSSLQRPAASGSSTATLVPCPGRDSNANAPPR